MLNQFLPYKIVKTLKLFSNHRTDYSFVAGFRVAGNAGNLTNAQTPPMLVCKYVDENGFSAMLATKRSAGVGTRGEPENSVAHR